MGARRLQVALEFMIVFAFILLVFMFLFVVIASQRAQTLNSQIFSQEQLIAQSIAAQIDRALQSGSGYTARVPISGAIGTLNFQLFVTKNGAVIVNASVASQTLQAISYSSSKSVLSNPLYLQTNTFYYSLPITNGTITIQNSFGTICVDYQCPTISTQAGNLTLSSQLVHAALFSNPAGVVQGNANALPYSNNAISVLAWVRTNMTTGGTMFSYGTASPRWTASIGVNENGQSGHFFTDFYSDYVDSGVPISDGRWHLVGFSWPGGGSTSINLFVDNQVIPSTLTYPPSVPPATSYYISKLTDGTSSFNGLIASVQVYNSSLSASQVQSLYAQGIAATPIAGANAVGWWPLNGDTKDYSGYGYNGFQKGGIIFPTVAELFAKVTNQQGYLLPGALVGFTTTLGNFTNGQATTSFTNANGIATAFLTQQQNNGPAMVRAIAYNGNISAQGSLVGWWPLGTNQEGAAYDASGNGDSGTFGKNTGWTNPSFVASLNNAYVFIPASTSLQPTSQSWSFWFFSSALSPSQRLFGSGVPQGGSSSGIEAYINPLQDLSFNAMGQSCSTISPISNSTWYQASVTWNSVSGVFNCYLNGMLENSITTSGGIALSGPIYAGTDSFTPAKYFFPGSVANLQLYGTALTPTQIMQLYDQGIASGPVGNPIGWWPLNGDANDYSGNDNNGALMGGVNFAGAPISSGMGNNATSIVAASFNGYSVVRTALAQTSLGAFTVTAWLNPANLMTMTSTGYSVFNSAGTNNFQLWLNGGTPLGAVPGQGDEQLGIGSYKYRGYGISNNSWNFVAVAIANGNPNGRASVYANGAQPYSISIAPGPYSINGFAIGQIASGILGYNGLVANLQIYNRTLSSQQVYQIFKQGVAGAPLNSTGTNFKLLLWYPLDGNVNDYSGSGNNGTANSLSYSSQSALRQATPTPFAATGANFNGRGSYINIANSVALRPTSGGVTLNAWIRINGTPQTPNPFVVDSTGGMCGGCGGYAMTLSNYATPIFWVGDASGFYSDNAMRALNNNWHMLTGDYNSSNLTVYIDGISVNSIAHTGQLAYGSCVSSACNLTIGASTSSNPLSDANNFAGSIADVRLYNTGLTQSQVKNLYQSQAAPSAGLSIPLSWYP
jgi:hypothetical protein